MHLCRPLTVGRQVSSLIEFPVHHEPAGLGARTPFRISEELLRFSELAGWQRHQGANSEPTLSLPSEGGNRAAQLCPANGARLLIKQKLPTLIRFLASDHRRRDMSQAKTPRLKWPGKERLLTGHLIKSSNPALVGKFCFACGKQSSSKISIAKLEYVLD